MVIRYDKSYEQQWDRFVLEESVNGCFLQTRNFLNYHKEGKFVDHSLVFLKGEAIVAVMPANELENKKVLISHQGSTFGGILFNQKSASIAGYDSVFSELLAYLTREGISRIEIRTPGWLYYGQDVHMELLDYYYEMNGFHEQCEVGFFTELSKISEGFEKQFATLRRRKLKKSLKNGLIFRKLNFDAEISDFYDVLSDNMKKFDTVPVHSLKEMLEFKNERLKDIVSFYGVYDKDEMVAGSMVFDFNKGKVFHTQYLASRQDRLELCPNEFLYMNLMKEAKERGYRFLSFGTSTLEHGAVFNRRLALYKEGFHTESYVNRTYILHNNLEEKRDEGH